MKTDESTKMLNALTDKLIEYFYRINDVTEFKYIFFSPPRFMTLFLYFFRRDVRRVIKRCVIYSVVFLFTHLDIFDATYIHGMYTKNSRDDCIHTWKKRHTIYSLINISHRIYSETIRKIEPKSSNIFVELNSKLWNI